jgi:uncharacterized protein YjbI with pentapeptide repeats
MEDQKLNRIIKWAKIIRDIGLIIGVPTLIIVGSKLYEQQIEVLKQEIESLKTQNAQLAVTQYDKALSMLESQKKLFQLERENLENQISGLAKVGVEKESEIEQLRAQIIRVDKNIQKLDFTKAEFGKAQFAAEANFQMALFEKSVSFYAAVFRHPVDFSYASFSDIVNFDNAAFKATVSFNGADLRFGLFEKTDLRGVDLSQAIIDSKTKFPNTK